MKETQLLDPHLECTLSPQRRATAIKLAENPERYDKQHHEGAQSAGFTLTIMVSSATLSPYSLCAEIPHIFSPPVEYC